MPGPPEAWARTVMTDTDRFCGRSCMPSNATYRLRFEALPTPDAENNTVTVRVFPLPIAPGQRARVVVLPQWGRAYTAGGLCGIVRRFDLRCAGLAVSRRCKPPDLKR